MEKVCIVCPKGCHLTVTRENGSICVAGNFCPRGKQYAEQELTNPRRVVTACAPTRSKTMPYLPVRTPSAVAKGKIPQILTQIYALRLNGPIAAGDIVIADCDGEGTPVIASTALR